MSGDATSGKFSKAATRWPHLDSSDAKEPLHCGLAI